MFGKKEPKITACCQENSTPETGCGCGSQQPETKPQDCCSAKEKSSCC